MTDNTNESPLQRELAEQRRQQSRDIAEATTREVERQRRERDGVK